MAPVVAAALISAAASMAKAQADKKASSQGGGNNYQVDIKTPGENGPQMKVEDYKSPETANASNTNGALIDAGSSVLQSVVNSKMQSSDERLKNIFGDNEDIIKIFSKINAIEFKYNDKAHDIPGGEEKGIDEDLHLGIKAQDLEKSPLTASAVSEDENGNKIVDTKELTMANSAVLSEICKRLEAIEKVLDIKVV
jgi:hypothetical protein